MALWRPPWSRSSSCRTFDASCQARARLRHGARLTSDRGRYSATQPAVARAPASTLSPHQHRFGDSLAPANKTELHRVLDALQLQEPHLLRHAFLQWTEVLADTSSPSHRVALRQVQELPGPSFSEILRSLDPVASGHKHDVADGLNLTAGHVQFTSASKLVDDFGVRRHHGQILDGLQTLVEVRSASPRSRLTAADYEVLMRCAGVSVNYRAAKRFWTDMADKGLQESRTAKTWTEFIKSRFVTEPAYYQFDRSRVAVMARDLYSNRCPLPMATLRRMDSLRFSLNALKKEPWNRRRDEPDEDVRRLLRRRTDFRGFKGHWIRELCYGHEVDTELLSVALIAFARSSSLRSIKTLILKDYYNIDVDEHSDPGKIHVSGGADLAADSAIRPNGRFLNAIVEAFGSMSHIPLGMKLLDFISRRYDVPIPPETWSNLLSWTYLCASKPFKPLRRLHGDHPSAVTSAADVRAVWDVMTSPPYTVTPTFEDHAIYIKTLLSQRSFGRALTLIRRDILPFYNRILHAHALAIEDEILHADVFASSSSSSSSHPTHRRLQLQTQKDYIHHHISSWLTRLLKTASSTPYHRTTLSHTFAPALLLEFADFLPHQVRYRSAQGLVQLDRPLAPRRFDFRPRFRRTLPQKKGGVHARDTPGADEPAFAWPRAPTLNIFEWQRRPRLRAEALGRPPEGEGPHEWWDGVEDELLL